MENITSQDQKLDEAINNDVNQTLKELFEKREAFIKSMNTRPNVKVSKQTFDAYQNGMGHYSKGEFDKAFEYFTKASEGGHSPSMYKLGMMYSRGEHVERDYAKAMEMFKKAIKNDGDVDSVFMIATMYLNGLGVEQNKRKAFDLFMQAGFSDHALAQGFVGNIYLEGTDGISPSPEKSFAWYKLSADNNEPSSMYVLSSYYLDGICVEKDVEKGIELLTVCADQYDYALACHKLANYYRKGEYVEKDEEKAFGYAEKAGRLGNTNGFLLYTQMLIKGQGCKQNVEGALNALEMMAVEYGNKDARLALANNYLFIDEVTPNPKRAVELLRPLIADTSDMDTAFNALFFIALMPSKYDVEEAGLTYKEVYESMKLCEQNTSSFNQTDLGLLYLAFYKMYTNGKYLKVDEKLATYYLSEAIECGNYDAMFITADHLFNGTFVMQKNMKEAFSLYQTLEEIKVTPELAERLAYCYRYGKGTTKAIRKAEKYEKLYTVLTGKEFPRREEEE